MGRSARAREAGDTPSSRGAAEYAIPLRWVSALASHRTIRPAMRSQAHNLSLRFKISFPPLNSVFRMSDYLVRKLKEKGRVTHHFEDGFGAIFFALWPSARKCSIYAE